MLRLDVKVQLLVLLVVLVLSSQLLPLLLPRSERSSARFLLYPLVQKPLSSGKCVMFNFGDSNSDTGGLVAGAGFRLHRPVGRRFFGKPSGRFCDGRLYIDFICERLGIDYLSPYLESSGENFRHGANFAVTGATTDPSQSKSFGLSMQVRQFRHFKSRTAELLPLGLGSLITEEEFQKAVYSFDIGQNDISVAFSANLTYQQILETIPSIVTRIKNAVTMVYESGGRKFQIYNTGPFGCLPSTLAWWRKVDSELDAVGCLTAHNNIAKSFNAQLSRLCNELRSKFPKATVVCIDMYASKYEMFANHTEYGFSNPLMACCGNGGPPYNYRAKMTCGHPKVKACSGGSRYISWDGLHYTEAANKIVADKILSSEYSHPQLPLETLCNG